MHSPCQLVAPVSVPAAVGIPAQLGVAGPPVNLRPWATSLEGLAKLTTPPEPTVAVEGIQEWVPYPYGPGSSCAEMLGVVSEAAMAGSTPAASPSTTASGR